MPKPFASLTRHSRLTLWLALLISVLLAIGWSRSSLLDWGLQQLLQLSPLESSKVTGLRIGRDHGELATLEFAIETRVGRATVQLENIGADYALRPVKLKALSIGQARLQLDYQPSESSANPDSSPAPAWPLPLLRIEKLDLHLTSPWGESQFSGFAEIKQFSTEALQATLQDNEQNLQLVIDSGYTNAQLTVQQTTDHKIFHLDAGPLNQAQQQAKLEADVTPLLIWLNTSLLIPDRLRGKLSAYDHPSLSAMHFVVTAATTDRYTHATAQALLTREHSYLASVDLTLQRPYNFDLDAHLALPANDAVKLMQPWLPESTRNWQLSSGQLWGQAQLHWRDDGESSGTAQLKAYDLNLAVGSLTIENGTVELKLTDLTNRRLSISADATKLQLGKSMTADKLQILAHYEKSLLTVEQATLALFGGSLAIAPGPLTLAQPPTPVTLMVQDIDLSRLLASLDYPTLSGSGRVSGELPIKVSEDSIELQEGSLTGNQPGVIRYQGPSADMDSIAFKALRNLAYHSLQAQLNYRPNGDYHLGLRLEGNNPEVLSGHPLAFNLNVSGQLPELLRRGLVAGDFERAIMEQAISQPNKPSQTMPLPADRRKQ